MVSVGVHEAKTQFSKLLRRVAAGEEILILRGRVPIARLVPLPGMTRRLGTEPALKVPDDFDDPLPDEVLATFDG